MGATIATGLVVGVLAALATEFLIRPILRFRELRFRITSDLVYFANAPADPGQGRGSELFWQRVEANRRAASDLQAWYVLIPAWARPWLIHFWRWPGSPMRDPTEAVGGLIGLSNSSSFEDVRERVEEIRRALNIPKIVN